MRAVRVEEFGPPEVMKLVDVPEPEVGAGQVLVRVHAAGVNPVDTYIRSGVYAAKPALPYTPGSDAAGVVERVGEGVTGLSAGDRIYTAGTITGSYAELALCQQSQVHRLPENTSFAQGAGVYVPYATAYRALFRRAAAEPGEVVLVHGASGGVGTASVQLARAAGLVVIGTAGSEKGSQLVKEQGAHHVFNHHDADYLQRVMEVTEGRGVDVVLEMLANVNLAKDLDILARNGRVVVIGNRGTIEINPRAAMARDGSILAMTLLNASPAEISIINSALVAGMEAGVIRPVVGQELPLDAAPRAHEEVMRPGAYGKIVLLP